MILVMGAVICGITELADTMVYFENSLAFYTEHYGIEIYPSKPTLSRLLNLFDGNKVGTVVAAIMRENAEDIGDIIAVDGKAIRSTGEKSNAHSFLQILTAYATESGVTIGQEAIAYEDKTNEIPVFQSMLDCMDIKGKIITADAMHCQKATCKKIISKGGDYVFGLKGNQGNLSNDVRLFFEDPINSPDCVAFETLEKNGGRVEKRVCRACDKIDWISDLPLWPGLKAIFAVTRTTTAKGATKEETGYYISSLPLDPQKLLHVSRSHWMVESMHWMLDVIWREDESGILSDNGNKMLSSFRKLALLAHKRYVAALPKKLSVKGNVLAALLNHNVLSGVLAYL